MKPASGRYGSPTILASQPGAYAPRPDQVLATMKRYGIGVDAAVVTCRYAYALWLGRRRDLVARDCDAGGQVLVEKRWEAKQFRESRIERANIRTFAKKAEANRRAV